MSKAKMLAAKELIKEKQYDEARAILRTVSNPTATEWLKKIDKISPQRTSSRATSERDNVADRSPRMNETPDRRDTSNNILYSASPSMFRAQPIGFIIVLFSCLFLVGIPFLLLWWLSAKNTKLTVTDDHIILKHGILSKSINEVYLTDVRNVKIAQGLFQRLMGTGTIEISTASSSFDDIIVHGLPHPYKIKDIINDARRR
jgi:membrane protein YdbS with pleckstrin-like domain